MNRANTIVVAVLAVVMSMAEQANADTSSLVVEETDMPALAFTTTDRVDGSNGSDFQFSLFGFTEDFDDAVGLKVDLSFQAFNPGGGIGVYGGMPVSALIVGDSGTVGIGNPELGVAYAKRKGRLGVVARAGGTVPIASGSSGSIANLRGGLSRVGDMALVAPAAAWLRTSASALMYRDTFVARVDVGVDVPLYGAEQRVTHFSFGVATGHPNKHTRTWRFELAMSSGIFFESVATINAGVALKGGTYIGVTAPIHDGARGQVLIVSVGFNGGVNKPSASLLNSSAVAMKREPVINEVCEAWKTKLAAATGASAKLRLVRQRPDECSK